MNFRHRFDRRAGLPTWLLAALGLCPALVLAACSSGDGSPTAQDDSGTEDGGGLDDAGGLDGSSEEPEADAGAPEGTTFIAYCSETADAYFSWLQRCYGAQSYSEAKRPRFVADTEVQCRRATRAVEEGRLGYDAAQATRCLESIQRDMDCVGVFLDSPACKGVFTGSRALGEDCYPDETRSFVVGVETCREGYCEVDDSCPGSCVSFAARGASCEAKRCAPDDYCEQTQQRCQARKQLGERCDDDLGSCAEDLACNGETCIPAVRGEGGVCGTDAGFCVGPSVCSEGQCRSRVQLGQTCILSIQCPEGAVCADGSAGEGRVCLEPRGEGGACTSGGNQCQASLVCVVPEGATVGACAPNPHPAPTAGEPCDDNGGCADGLWCQRADFEEPGVCTVRGDVDAACLSFGKPHYGSCRDGLHCSEAGKCAAPGKFGEPCNVLEGNSCQSGLSCSRDTGRCAEPAAEGERCNPYVGGGCAAGLGCACGDEDRALCGAYSRDVDTDDRCRPQVEAGGDCYRGDECKSLSCQFDFEQPASTPGKCQRGVPVCEP